MCSRMWKVFDAFFRKSFHPDFLLNKRRVQVLLVKNEKEHAWAINSRNID